MMNVLVPAIRPLTPGGGEGGQRRRRQESCQDAPDCLADILEASGKISNFISGLDSGQFAADEKTFYTVIRGLAMSGHGTSNPSDSE
jgi:hypothetical protein